MKIKQIYFYCSLVIFMSGAIFAQKKPLGLFEANADVGEVKKAGSDRFDATNGQYLLEGSGTNMWYKRDDFQFVWNKMKGDFILTARAGIYRQRR